MPNSLCYYFWNFMKYDPFLLHIVLKALTQAANSFASIVAGFVAGPNVIMKQPFIVMYIIRCNAF